MSGAALYRLLEAYEDCPDAWMTLSDALAIAAPHAGSVSLKVGRSLLHLEGTAFYLQPMTDGPDRAA